MDLLEYYHRTGKCPDRFYNQLNGKTAQENYETMLARRQEFIQERLEAEQLEQQIEKRVAEAVEKALADLFAGFGK